MNSLIIYYSLEGNTEWVANLIARETGAELFPLQPKKQFPREGCKKYFWGGKSVLFHEVPELVTPVPDLSGYDRLYIGTPIWAGSYASPIQTFLSSQPISGKSIYLFACHGGGGADKCFTKLRQQLSGNRIQKTIDFFDPLKQDSQEAESRLKAWLSEQEPNKDSQ